MKTLFKSFLLALALLAAFGATLFLSASAAQARPIYDPAVRSAVYPNQSGSKLHVMLEKGTTQTVSIYLLDKNQKALAVQPVGRKSGAYRLTFDVVELPAGEYQVKIVSDKSVSEHPFTINEAPVTSPARQISLQ